MIGDWWGETYVHTQIGEALQRVPSDQPAENSRHCSLSRLINWLGWNADDLGADNIVEFPPKPIVLPINLGHLLGRIFDTGMAREATLTINPDRRPDESHAIYGTGH